MVNFDDIDRMRIERKIPVMEFCRSSDISYSVFWRAKKRKTVPQRQILVRMVAALDVPPARPVLKKQPLNLNLIKSVYRGFVIALCLYKFKDPALVLSSNPRLRANHSKDWVVAAEIRSIAVYATIIELNLKGADVARAIGMTRQAVSLMLRRVEDMRDDADIDQLIEHCGYLMCGRNAA